MNILITAGSTQVNIDQVRVISNIFRGTTGTRIADIASQAPFGHTVTLLTSGDASKLTSVRSIFYRTYDELAEQMEREIRTHAYDAVIHSAAVSDYRVASIRTTDLLPLDAEVVGTKIGSNHERLFLELVPTEKLIDKIRSPWGFTGTLVKFKLQVGITDEALIKIARHSMQASKANVIVANCREWAKERAYILDARGTCVSVARAALAEELLRRIS